MLKKFGMVSVGVTATLLAAAPLASASECHDGHESHKSHHKSHEGSSNNTSCSAKSGDVKGNKGELAGSALDGNAGQILSCNSLLNGFAKGNTISVL